MSFAYPDSSLFYSNLKHSRHMYALAYLFFLKDGTDGVVSTASTTTSNPLPTLYCYDISGSNDRGG